VPVASDTLTKVADNAARLKDFPHITKEGKWQTTPDGYWTGGFWVGLLWLCYKLSRDGRFADWAYVWLRKLEGRKQDETFDIGFLFYPSFVLGYRITRDESFKRVALEAANTLSGLFHQKSGFVYNEIDLEGRKVGRTAIDAMMNLPILWWAYDETGEKRYYQPAYQHSLNTMEKLVREDYSTFHVLDFDLGSGKTIRKLTIQGYSNDSCWSRGQAWAIYGFTLAYHASQDRGFLEVAKGLANYFVGNLHGDYVPYWDFNDPGIPHSVRDSSAAAIACSTLFTLSVSSQKQELEEVATKMLNSLTKNYLSEDSECILKHGCFHKPENLGVDEGTIWGDYYFMEAIAKQEKLNEDSVDTATSLLRP